MPEQDKPYHIGYGKPPKSGQFARGRSGNPKGRPKGSKNFATMLLRESRECVRINGPRGSRTITKAGAAVKQMANSAAQGDLRSQREFFHLIQRSEEVANTDIRDMSSSEADQEAIKSIFRRMKQISLENPAPGPTGSGEKP